MGITGFFLGLTRFYWVLLGFSGSCWIFIRFQILPACSQGYSFGFCGFVSSFQPSVGGAAVIGGLSSIKKKREGRHKRRHTRSEEIGVQNPHIDDIPWDLIFLFSFCLFFLFSSLFTEPTAIDEPARSSSTRCQLHLSLSLFFASLVFSIRLYSGLFFGYYRGGHRHFLTLPRPSYRVTFDLLILFRKTKILCYSLVPFSCLKKRYFLDRSFDRVLIELYRVLTGFFYCFFFSECRLIFFGSGPFSLSHVLHDERAALKANTLTFFSPEICDRLMRYLLPSFT